MNNSLKIEFNDLIGIPFKVHGRDLNGLDCYGLVKLIEERKGNIIPEYAYSDTEKTFVHKLINDNMPIVTELEKPEPLCTVTFSIRQPWIHHIGIVLYNTNYFIHAMRKRYVVIERLDTWKNKIRGYYTWNH